MYDLLRAMQVCRTLKETIDNSHKLRKNLFLTPKLPRPKLVISKSGTLLSGARAVQQIATAEAAGKRETGDFTCCVLHPALQLDPEIYRAKYHGMVEYAAGRFDPRNIFFNDWMVMRDSIWSWTENGSKLSGLDNMLVTQPPVTSLHIVTPGMYDYDCHAADETVGVTFGDVFKAVISASYWFRNCRQWRICFDQRAFVVSAEARAGVERAGELSSEDDPTRWVFKDGKYVLKEGGFEFV